MKKNFTVHWLLIVVAAFISGCGSKNGQVEPRLEGKHVVARPMSLEKTVWAHEGSELKADPNVTWGKLDNGFRYVILPTREASGRASLQLHMDVGSLFETDEQQGMAHFLEHMAFNGGKHSPAGETTEFFQRLGMSFGAHTNALTTFDQTNYKLELPRANEELTDASLNFFRDVLDGLLLPSAEIEKERGVILSERMARNSSDFRGIVASLRFNFPELPLAQRLPIGLVATVKKMTREQFVEFYEKWYTPGRATVVAVGDFDVAMVEKLIQEKFADAVARRGEQPTPSFGKLDIATGPRAMLHRDADAGAVTVTLSTVRPVDRHNSIAGERDSLVQILGNLMLNTRMQTLTRAANSSLLTAQSGGEQLVNIAELHSLAATCRPEQWSDALSVVEQELRRVMKFGFSAAEFENAKKNIVNVLQAQAEQAATRQPVQIAERIVETIAEEAVFSHPSEDLRLCENLLSTITKTDCETALRGIWAHDALRVMVQGNVSLGDDADKAILAALADSRKQPVTAPDTATKDQFVFADLGPSGEIVERKTHADLDIVSAKFANQVRVNVKRTTLEKNAVQVSVRFGGGLLETPTNKPGLTFLANNMFIGGGLESHTLTELNSFLADKNAVTAFSVTDDAFQLGGRCSPDHLETQLQMCAAYLTAPALREEAYQRALQNLNTLHAEAQSSPEGTLAFDGCKFLRSGDTRFKLPASEELRETSLADLKAWLAQPLKKGYLEIGIVGDVDPDHALSLVAKTLGALPERDSAKPAFAQARELKYPVGKTEQHFSFRSETDRAILLVSWPILGERDIPLERRLAVLGEILTDRLRLKIRRELGATYTPEVIAALSDAFPKYGYLAAVMIIDANRLAEVGPLVRDIATEMATGPLSNDEVERALRPAIASLDDLNNGYWMNIVKRCQESPVLLDVARSRSADFRAINKADLEALAKKYLAKEQATVIHVAPAPAAKAASLSTEKR